MASVVLEGLVEGLTPKQKEFIENKIKELGFGGGKIVLERVGKPGDNFATDVRRIVAEKNGKTLKIIAKIASSNPELRMAMNIECIFGNEHYMYTEVLPKFSAFEEAAGVPESERLKYVKCYGTLFGEPCEVILLEDLQVDGYKMKDKFKSLADHDVKRVLKNLAALHSLSYAMKNQEPETFNSLKNKLKSMMEAWEHIEQYWDHFIQMEKEVLQIITEKKYRKELEGRISKLPQLLPYSSKIGDDKYKVINQGDCWTNNLLFLSEDDQTVSCCMIDYQLSFGVLPVGDIGYMIFNCTDHESRMKHFNDWLDYYHEQLEKYLSYHNLKADVVYPKDNLLADMKRFGEISLTQGILVSSFILRESKDAETVKTALSGEAEGDGTILDNLSAAMSTSTMQIETVKKFKTRIEQLVDSHLELGLL